MTKAEFIARVQADQESRKKDKPHMRQPSIVLEYICERRTKHLREVKRRGGWRW